MKPVLLEIRDRIDTLCDSIELNNIDCDATLSQVRNLLSLVGNFVTRLPNNNAFLNAAR